MPFHVARKPIPGIDAAGKPEVVAGMKFETFVFDALPFAERSLVMETDRREEFSPIKNKEGEDSAQSSVVDQMAQFARWLEAAGVEVPREQDGTLRHRIEISPLFANTAEEVLVRRGSVREIRGDLYLGEAASGGGGQ